MGMTVVLPMEPKSQIEHFGKSGAPPPPPRVPLAIEPAWQP